MGVGSRFSNKSESNYSPTDGEFTARADGLEKTAYFTLGCENLTIGTDHNPLVPIINGTCMDSIKTPRQHRLREKLLRWNLTAQYIPGKYLGGTDALSRYGIRDNNDEAVGWLPATLSILGDTEDVTHWPEEALCHMVGARPPVTNQTVVTSTASDKTLNNLSKHRQEKCRLPCHANTETW